VRTRQGSNSRINLGISSAGSLIMGNGQGSRKAPENPFVSQASYNQFNTDMAVLEDTCSKILSMWVIRRGRL